jgi:hypothetical protein
MKKIILIASVVAFGLNAKAQIFIGEKTKLSFFSATSLENIDAVNSNTKPLFNAANGTFAMKAQQTEFKFKSAFMEEHYNENYVESEKFPFATFTGKVTEKVDYTKDGVYQVTVVGKLSMHGVELERTIKGTITVSKGMITIDSKFEVKVADHKIKVPSLYVEKIAEIIQVTIHSEMIPKK